MPNEEHIRHLKLGVEVWNEWVRINRMNTRFSQTFHHEGARVGVNDFFAELDGADLSGQDLYQARLGAGFSGIDLSGADLRGADLRGAKLAWARLVGATLEGANLSNAILSNADFEGANLIDTDLSDANIAKANFLMTNLSGANLKGAFLYEVFFSDTDLTAVQGLLSCHHVGPSTIDLRTFLRSGSLPPSFLRGCGLTDAQIGAISTLISQPVQYYSCFISYSSKDKEFAEKLHGGLQDVGVNSWFAPKDLKSGERFRIRIDESIWQYDKMLLILSENSVSSQGVEKEVETALEREERQKNNVLIPVRLDDTVLEMSLGWAADIRRSRHCGDFTNWKSSDAYNKAFERLMRDLKAEAGR